MPESLPEQEQLAAGQAARTVGQLLDHAGLHRVDRSQPPERRRVIVRHLIDKTDLQRFVSAQNGVAEEEGVSGGAADDFAPARRAAETGGDAEFRAGMRKPASRRRKAEIECEREIERSAETVAV